MTCYCWKVHNYVCKFRKLKMSCQKTELKWLLQLWILNNCHGLPGSWFIGQLWFQLQYFLFAYSFPFSIVWCRWTSDWWRCLVWGWWQGWKVERLSRNIGKVNIIGKIWVIWSDANSRSRSKQSTAERPCSFWRCAFTISWHDRPWCIAGEVFYPLNMCWFQPCIPLLQSGINVCRWNLSNS